MKLEDIVYPAGHVAPDALARYDGRKGEHGGMQNGLPDESFRPGGPMAFRPTEVPVLRWGPPRRFRDVGLSGCDHCGGIDFFTAPYWVEGVDRTPVATAWSTRTGQPIVSLCDLHASEFEARHLDGRRPMVFVLPEPTLAGL